MSLERDAAAAQALLGWGGGGAAAFLFSLVLFGTGGNKKTWVVQPQGYPQQPMQGYPPRQ